MMLLLLRDWKKFSSSFNEWFMKLVINGIVSGLLCLCLFFIVDSLWYGRITCAAVNSFLFNIIENSSFLFGKHNYLVYLDFILRDNTAFLLIFCLLTLVCLPIINSNILLLNKDSIYPIKISIKSEYQGKYILPYLLTFCYLQTLDHKQERFLYFLFPVMSLYAGFLFELLLSIKIENISALKKKNDGHLTTNTTEKGSHNNKMTNGQTQNTTYKPRIRSRSSKSHFLQYLPYLRYLIVLIIFFVMCIYVVSGLSAVLIRDYQFSLHHYFFKFQVGENILKSTAKLQNITDTLPNCMNSNVDKTLEHFKDTKCLVAVPWSSWRLPTNCKLYTIQLLDEFFDGYNNVSFRRFENVSESGFIPMYSTKQPLFIESQNDWDHNVQLPRVNAIGNTKQWNTSALHDVDHIILQGGGNISSTIISWSNEPGNFKIRHKKIAHIIFYYEILFGKYLPEHFQVEAEASPFSYFDLSVTDRIFGSWPRNVEKLLDSRAISLIYWKRKNITDLAKLDQK